jgi:hypothetical protein
MQQHSQLDALAGFDNVKKATTRTTFALTSNAHDALSWLAERNGSQREVFDGLAVSIELRQLGDDDTDDLANSLPPVPSGEKIRKTFVVNRQFLKILSKFAEAYDLTRDEAVERLLLHYRPIVENNRRLRHENQRKVEDLWQEVRDAAARFEQQAKQLLPEDDPVLDYFLGEVSWVRNCGIMGSDDGEPIMEDIS